MSLTAELLNEFQFKIKSLEVLPSRGGVFEVMLDGDVIFSKKQLDRHAEEGEILGLLRSRIP